MRLTGVVLGICAVVAAGSGSCFAGTPSREALSFRKVIAASKAEIARLHRLNAELEGQKNLFAVRLAKAETRNDPKPAQLRSLEQNNTALEESVTVRRQEIAVLKARLKDAEKKAEQVSRELQAYRIVRAALDTRTRQLAAQSAAAARAQQDKRDALFKVAGITRERLALQEENAELRRRINIVSDNFDREKAAVYREVGAAYTDADMLREAIFAYNEAIRYDPKNAKAHYALGVLYAASGSGEKAIEHLKQYLWLTPYAANKKEVEYLIKTVVTHKEQD